MSKINMENIKATSIYNDEEKTITMRFLEDNSKYGQIDYELAKVELLCDMNAMMISIDKYALDEENADDFINKLLISVINKFSKSKLSTCDLYDGDITSLINSNSYESIKNYLLKTNITMISEYELEEEKKYEKNIRKYTLGYMPEHRMFN